jgi:3-hydroxyisobutyrate dehydrogenase-like beta-hydroxyacid dehydrogenase
MKVLWTGYGKMGTPMAYRVREAGHVVTVHDISAERRQAARDDGFPVTDTLTVASEAELIVSSLPHDVAAAQTLRGDGGVLAHAPRDATLLETSTISLSESALIAVEAQARGVGYVRAPVSGSVHAARDGRLSAFVSGAGADLVHVGPVLESFVRGVLHAGRADEARLLKLAINLMVATQAASLAEAHALAVGGGVSPAVALEAIGASALSSPHLSSQCRRLADGDLSPTFTVNQMLKDLGLVADAARALGVPTWVSAAAHQLLVSTQAAGLGERDYIACVTRLADMASS